MENIDNKENKEEKTAEHRKIVVQISKDRLIKYNRDYKQATPMDDVKFREICKSKGAIEEILRVILNDPELEITELIKQSDESLPIFHGVVLDCKCILGTGELVNVEVQIENGDDPEFRMRYNCSVLTVENSPKSKSFKYKDIPRVILIMFCSFDPFGKGQAIYEVKRVVEGTDVIADNGVRELYINLTAEVSDTKLKSLFKIMSTVDEVDEKEFPILSQTKIDANELNLGGKNNMSGLSLEMYTDGVEDGRKEGQIATYFKLINHGLIKEEVALNDLNLSKDEFDNKVRELGM